MIIAKYTSTPCERKISPNQPSLSEKGNSVVKYLLARVMIDIFALMELIKCPASPMPNVVMADP